MECKKCKFFETVLCSTEGMVGECRRFPPKPDGKGVHTIDEFPIVRLNYWCGEYKKGAKK